MVEIIKGLKIPPRGLYPWSELEIGDAIEMLPTQKSESFRTLACAKGRELKRKFLVRKLNDKFYAWRVK